MTKPPSYDPINDALDWALKALGWTLIGLIVVFTLLLISRRWFGWPVEGP